MNRCLSLARVRIPHFPFDDDLMMPQNLERKVDMQGHYPQVGLVHSRYHVWLTARAERSEKIPTGYTDQSGRLMR